MKYNIDCFLSWHLLHAPCHIVYNAGMTRGRPGPLFEAQTWWPACADRTLFQKPDCPASLAGSKCAVQTCMLVILRPALWLAKHSELRRTRSMVVGALWHVWNRQNWNYLCSQLLNAEYNESQKAKWFICRSYLIFHLYPNNCVL